MLGTLYQEPFSEVFLRAVAARANCSLSKPTPDNRGIDWTLSAHLPLCSWKDPKVDVQLKSAAAHRIRRIGDELSYDLKVGNYRKLLADEPVQRILILVELEDDDASCLEMTTEALLVRRAAYWACLRGLDPRYDVEDDGTVAVRLPSAHHLTPVELIRILTLAGNLEKL